MAFENSIQVLQKYAKKQVREAQKNVKESRTLRTSIRSMVQGDFEKTPMIKFSLPYYAGFVDTGVEGTGEGQKKDENGNLTKYKVAKKTTLKSKFANEIFNFKRQPAFSGKKTMIPTSAIDKWVVTKGLEGTRDEKGRFISRKSLKFAIAKRIYQKGLGQGGSFPSLAGKGFFSKPLKKNITQLTKELSKAYAKDLVGNIKDELV